MSSLIILDINGILAYKYLSSEEKKLPEIFQEVSLNKMQNMSYRSDCSSFIDSLLKKYKVGLYSSTTKYNVENMLKIILSPQQIKKLSFILTREFTIIDPEGDNKWSTFKSIEYVSIHYGVPIDQIIIIDDDESKIRRISDNNKILVEKDSLKISGHFKTILENIEIKLNETKLSKK